MKQHLDLENFFPYQFSILAQQMSEYIAQIYRQQYGLSRFEWRALAAIAQQSDITAKDIMQITRLDKMQVSRAIAKLSDSGYVTQIASQTDRRSSTLSLSKEGQALYEEIVPQVLTREQELLSHLTQQERNAYTSITHKLSQMLEQS
ncbi:MAG: MarR family winged helix-turn-helix transcriptional regulator [Psychrobium sp.]